MNVHNEIDEEKPLDPATERVRRKLAKTGAVFMGLNMLALMAVLGAIVYKLSNPSVDDKVPAVAGVVPIDPGFEKIVDIPEGAKLLSASENNSRVLLNLELADGRRALWFYDLQSGQVIGKLSMQ